MCAALRQGDGRDRDREEELDWKLESSGDSERAHTQLSLVVGEADHPSGDEPAHGRQRAGVAAERRDQPTADAQSGKQDAATGRRTRFLLVAFGQLGLDHLSGLKPLQSADERPVQHEGDDECDHKCDQVKSHLVSSCTTSSNPALRDALMSTRSPRFALFLTQMTADSRSGSRCALDTSARDRPISLSRTATASNTSAALRPTRRCDSSASAPSSPIAPSTASSLPLPGRSASVSKAASIDSGLAVYAAATMTTPFAVSCSWSRCGTATSASADAPSPRLMPANSPAASAARALRAWCRPSSAR